MQQELIIGGRYRHYKGNEYTVVAVANHSETHEPLVIYQSLKDATEYWARPKDMFLEYGDFQGKEQFRFTLIV